MLSSINCLYGQQGSDFAHQNSSLSVSITEPQVQYIKQVVKNYIYPQKWFKSPQLALDKVDIDNGDTFYKCKFKDSLILTVPSREKILLYPHSSHQSKEIGDLTVAICEDGRVFLHFGHICGGFISFISKPGIKVYSANDFFLQTIDNIDDKPWIPLSIEL
jgi:hypothetical protein